jgi:hypothetical protein
MSVALFNMITYNAEARPTEVGHAKPKIKSWRGDGRDRQAARKIIGDYIFPHTIEADLIDKPRP